PPDDRPGPPASRGAAPVRGGSSRRRSDGPRAYRGNGDRRGCPARATPRAVRAATNGCPPRAPANGVPAPPPGRPESQESRGATGNVRDRGEAESASRLHRVPGRGSRSRRSAVNAELRARVLAAAAAEPSPPPAAVNRRNKLLG